MNQNNKLVIGSLLFLSGTILLGLMHVAIALYIPDLTGWSDPPGKIPTVLNEISGWFPYVLSIVQIIIGTILILISFLKDKPFFPKKD